MTFKHKLSCRLALLKDRWVVLSTAALALATLSACEKPTPLTGPDPSAVLRLVISPKVLTLQQNETADFTAVGLTSTGITASTSVRWSVTSGSMTDTSTTGDRHNGRYHAGSEPGTAKVVVSGPAASDTAVVTVMPAPVASVAVIPATASVQVGATVQLAAATTDSAGNALSGRAVAWTSSDPAVAVASPSGLVTAVAAGTTTITATSQGTSGRATVTVTTVPAPPPPPPPPSPPPAAVATVVVSPASPNVTVGQSLQLNATLKDASGTVLSGRTVAWASSAAGVGTVSTSGLVTGVGAGTATITATSEGVSGTAALTVTLAAVLPGTVSDLAVVSTTSTSVTLSFTDVNDGTGQAAKYDIRYGLGAISWATASSVTNGTCASPVAGSAIGAKRTCTVVSLAAGTVYGFELVAYRGTLGQGATFGALSNLVTATTAASTAPVAVVTVSPTTASVTSGQTLQLSAVLKDASGNVLSGRSVSWSSSAGAIATVSAVGLVTGVTTGSATITATSEGQSGSATITVAVLPPPSLGHAHEPAGMARIWEHNFSCLPGGGCDAAGASTHENLTYASTQLDPTAPVSPAGVFQVQWPAGWHDGVGPIVWDAWNTTDMYSSTRMREVYLSFEMKIPTPDFENQSVGTKLFYIEYGNTSQDNEGFLMLDNAYGYGQGEAIKSAWGLTMYLSEADDRTGVGDGKGHYQNVDATKYFTCGVWHQVEMYLKANTVDQSDGIFRMWIDGHLITEVLNQKYLDSRYAFTDGFFMFHMDPVWGGYAGNVKTRDDFMWYDHIYISGIRQ